MTAVLEAIRRTARARVQRLVLAESNDDRVVRAADRLSRDRIAEVTLIGARDEVRATARRSDVALTGVTQVDPTEAQETERTSRALEQARGERLAPADREKLSRDPIFQAATRVREGLADCFVAGATRPTADVLRASLWLIGLAPGIRTVSSYFIMVVPGAPGGGPAGSERVFMFADCAVVPDPTSEQLAEIACLTADHFARLIGQIPHTAFLSFSTRGSADHPHVQKVREAVGLARQRRPDLHFDGEMQLDAAIDADVGRRKAPDSLVAGHANVLIFPDLNAGNIGYKLVQRLAGAQAIGPILMGLARQGNDLSRGCSVEDVVEVSTIACALSATAAPAART